MLAASDGGPDASSSLTSGDGSTRERADGSEAARPDAQPSIEGDDPPDGGGTVDARVAARDSGLVADAGCIPNACGGCGTIAPVTERCGACGLGYSCPVDGMLDCVGADAQPSATAGTVIDDWEDGNERTADGAGRSQVYSDGTAAGVLDPVDGSAVLPTAGGANGSQGCAHVSGRGFETYAGMLVDLNEAGCTFDAAAAHGVSFWLKGFATDTVVFSVATHATKDPQLCGDLCNDFHMVRLPLTDGWQQHSILWSQLKQSGWGTPADFDPAQLAYLQFAFDGPVTFDLYLDELTLL